MSLRFIVLEKILGHLQNYAIFGWWILKAKKEIIDFVEEDSKLLIIVEY